MFSNDFALNVDINYVTLRKELLTLLLVSEAIPAINKHACTSFSHRLSSILLPFLSDSNPHYLLFHTILCLLSPALCISFSFLTLSPSHLLSFLSFVSYSFLSHLSLSISFFLFKCAVNNQIQEFPHSLSAANDSNETH